MRTLIYKRTHSGDPDPQAGVFGNHDCMGSVKGWNYDAVIGIGGIGPEPVHHRIAGKLTWIGIGPHKVYDNPLKPSNPRVTFDHFWYAGENGPLLTLKFPALAKRMYEKNVRVLMHRSPEKLSNSVDLDKEVLKILRLANRSEQSSESCKARSSPLLRCKPDRFASTSSRMKIATKGKSAMRGCSAGA